jgi:anhydro-N-acetylmuramic acid kinase
VRRLEELRGKAERVVVGLMSGTSADGVDAAVVRIAGSGPSTRVETLGFRTHAFSDAVREQVLALREARADVLCRWNVELGELFAAAALGALDEAGLDPGDADLVGSHGQTVVHLTPREGVGAATLQIGEPSVIAERTGLPVVADFRMRDVAAGGEGAPLVPWVDWLLLRPEAGCRLAQNLGGIGNVTLVTQGAEDVLAFDTGPGNAPLDAAAALLTDGRARCDEGGALAARGQVDEAEVQALLAHPFFRKPPPRSADRSTFGEELVRALVGRRPELSGPDVLATLTEFVARSVAEACREHLPADARPVDCVVSGGGVHNATLMGRLGRLLHPLPVRTSDAFGIDPDAKEAVAFAVLANETVHGHAGNLPRATGARWPVVLGKLVP